eukprot:5995909-Pleurochrysis_carterae.AAC.1
MRSPGTAIAGTGLMRPESEVTSNPCARVHSHFGRCGAWLDGVALTPERHDAWHRRLGAREQFERSL